MTVLVAAGIVAAVGYGLIPEPVEVDLAKIDKGAIRVTVDEDGKNLACVIAVGVVYNSARISLSERSRELATLRVIGFTRGEISAILLGELGIVTLLAIPLGLWFGYLVAALTVSMLDLELFRCPLVIERTTYGLAALVVMLASIASGLLVRRRLDQLDLIAVLKSRE